jgi:hypothetical protein
VALQIKEPLKYLEKNIPDLQKMAAAYMSLGTAEELRDQIIDVALDRAFLAEPLPTDAASFKPARIDRRPHRLNLIAQEVARLAGTGAAEYAAASASSRTRAAQGGGRRRQAQLQRLVPKRFMRADALGAAAALAALPEGHHAAAGQAARRPGARRRSAWPNCARWSSAGCAAWPSSRALADARWTNTAGCWKSCA